MALDVPTRSYVVPPGVDADALVSFLAERVDLVVDEPVTAETTVLDTVDRRLRAAGVEARVDAGRAGARLSLRDGSGRPPLAVDVAAAGATDGTGGTGPERWLAPDLPAGVLRDRLAPLLEERALLPLVRLRVEARAARVLNADAKTVVRLAVTSPVALAAPDPACAFTGGPSHAADGGIPLATRVVVSGVLGYPKPFARVEQLLAGELGLTESSHGAADEAIEALGGDPTGLRTKVRVELQPDQRADRAAVAVLVDLADIAESNISGTLDDLDSEFLHDLRVAVRKSRSVLRELKRVFPADALARQRETLKWVQAITGEARDLDVQMLDWDGLAAKVSPDRRAALAPVHELVARHRAAAVERLQAELRSRAFELAWASYRRFLSGKLGPAKERPDAKKPIAEVAGRRIRTVYADMVEMGSAIDERSPAEDLHDLRKKGKELRYLLELFGGLWPAETVRPLVKTLKGLQDVLGTHQDRAIQAESLGGLADEVATLPKGPDALLALGTLVERLEDEQHEAREAFAARFAPFAAKPQRKLFDVTFREAP